ncbi:thioesterase family protein [Streptomyces scabiei]|uniref:thioesterase family protein n=1 Tax=Streptomyces scabiei TaxID=1930 RepID=UPI00367FADF2
MARAASTEVKGRCERVVAPTDCATQWGNDGLEVLSTPAILGYTEQLCAEVLAPHLREGEMSVGVTATMHHRAAVPVGAKAVYSVTAEEVGRKTQFTFTVWNEVGTVVCEGTHLRATVDVRRFLATLEAARSDG